MTFPSVKKLYNYLIHKLVLPLWEAEQCLLNLNIYIFCDPGISLIGVYLTGIFAYVHQKTCAKCL